MESPESFVGERETFKINFQRGPFLSFPHCSGIRLIKSDFERSFPLLSFLVLLQKILGKMLQLVGKIAVTHFDFLLFKFSPCSLEGNLSLAPNIM